jgi:hypothetical protein
LATGLFAEVGNGFLTVGQRAGTRRIIHVGALPRGIGGEYAWRVLQGAELLRALAQLSRGMRACLVSLWCFW